MDNAKAPSWSHQSIIHEVSAVISFSMNVMLIILALTPRTSPPNNPYETHDELLWMAPLWLAFQLALGMIGIRSEGRALRLAALIAVVTPVMLLLAATIANWPEIRNCWRLPW
jgi:hypothetical protein